MICPKCGRDLEDGSRLCPWCGERLPTAEPSRRSSSGRKAATVAAVVVVVALVAALIIVFAGDSGQSTMSSGGDDDGGDDVPDTVVVSYEITEVADGVYASGALLDDFTFSLGTDDEGETVLTISLASELSDGWSKYGWFVTNSSWPWVSDSVTKDDPVLYWTITDSSYGEYTVGVICYNNDGNRPFDYANAEMYEIEVYLDGTVTETYQWVFQGTPVSVDLTYQYSDYLEYANMDRDGRSPYVEGSYAAVTSFVVVDDVIQDLSGRLAEAYTASFDADLTGQGYAEFLLSFVQECFGYSYDTILYGQDEYFAYPMETIYYGYGDCEDTAILLATLYTAAGYDAGIVILPGHAITAVALDEYTPTQPSPLYAGNVSQFEITVDGVTYYGCETTLTENAYGVGWISSDYGVDEDGEIVYEGETYPGIGYGLYLIESD